MRIDRLLLRALHFALLGALLLLGACPGELANKAAFEAYAATEGDAGAPTLMNEPGGAGTAGSTATSGSAGTDGNDGSAGNDNDACGDVATRIFVPSCGGTGCHSATTPQQDLDLVSPDLASRVVGVSGKQCSTLLADPRNPEQSLLYLKLSPTSTCGAPMPLARPALNSKDIACVLAWIAAQSL